MSDYLPCMRVKFCEIRKLDDCHDRAYDASDCDVIPEVCKTSCVAYSPCLLCQNSCFFDGDSDCDDGGSGAKYNSCPSGSDCDDCGLRVLPVVLPPPPLPPPLPPSAPPRPLSPRPPPYTDGSIIPCSTAPSSCSLCLTHWACLQYVYCGMMHDSRDCNDIVDFADVCDSAPPMCMLECSMFAHCFLCRDTCVFSSDHECDDGGEGASYAECPPGSDCADCGPRGGSFVHWHPAPPPSPSPPVSPLLPSPDLPPPPHTPPTLPSPPTPASSGAGATIAVVLLLLAAGAGGGVYLWYRRRSTRLTRLVQAHAPSSDTTVTPYIAPLPSVNNL